MSLKDRKRSEDLYSILGIQSVAKVVRYSRLRWFGHVERKNGDDWVSACRNVVMAGARCAGRGRKTWYECVRDDMTELGLHAEWAVFRDMWRGFISGKTSNPTIKLKLCRLLVSTMTSVVKKRNFSALQTPITNALNF